MGWGGRVRRKMALRYEALYARANAEVVTDYNQGWWMGSLAAPGGPALHVSGLESESEVLGALSALCEYLMRRRNKRVEHGGTVDND